MHYELKHGKNCNLVVCNALFASLKLHICHQKTFFGLIRQTKIDFLGEGECTDVLKTKKSLEKDE